MQLNRPTPSQPRDAGFTLVELLLVIVILGVITVPLSNVAISALRNHQATSDRMSLSHDAQISAAYFAKDVSGVGVRDYSVPPPPNSPPPFKQSIQLNAAYNAGAVCGSPSTPTAKLRLLSDNWDNSGASPTVSTDVVAYYLVGSELRRMKCVASSSPVSDVVVAHYVDPASLTVTCSNTCDSTAVPEHVTLSFTATTPFVDAYPVTLAGQRRQT
jgi:prepilin-type N-terminal cleavage/methylation domain-containing protein